MGVCFMSKSNVKLEDIQQDLFKVQSLAKVLKLASATTYVNIEVDDEDVQQVASVIEDITNELSTKITEII
jgi:hypothetical protein